MVGKRDVGEEPSRLVLEVTQHRQVRDTICVRLHVAVEHRTIRTDAELVCLTMDGNPLFTRQFLVSDCGTDAGAEHLGATAGHRVEPRFPEREQRFTNAHLINARDVRDLDGGEGLDMDVREIRLERAEHLRVVGEPRFHVQPTDNMKFTCQRAVRRRCFFEHLLEGVAIGAVFFRQSRI